MKTVTSLAFIFLTVLVLSAQDKDQGPIPKISQQITDYFNYYPREKVFIVTDKTHYKPGETIWFRSFVAGSDNRLVTKESSELFVKIYDKKGLPVVQEVFRINYGCAPGDMQIPETLKESTYFLVAYTSMHNSPEEITCIPLKIDPVYSDQWVAETLAKDSLFISGQKNELFVVLRDISGDIQKNTQLRYQLLNGTEIIEKGKLKTDEKGSATIPLTIPAKTNGEPFVCVLSDTKDEWKHEVFLPSNLDPVIIHFYPEGGNFTSGIATKIGFTAFNNWGLPVNVEGSVLDQDREFVTSVKTFTKGLGLFSLMNDGKQQYKFEISGKTGQSQSFDLPAPLKDGLAFTVVKNDAGFISTNLVFGDKQKHPIAMTVTNGGNLYWAANMDIDGIGRIKIPTEDLPNGINLLSVFSQEGRLLAERIVFVDKNQQFNIEVKPEKSNLKPNENMLVKIRLTDENNQPVAGNLAISVTDKFRDEPAANQIYEYLLIGSELETPFSLISKAVKGKMGNSPLMDVFLIANQTKSFNWEKIRNFKPEDAQDFNTDKSGLTGVVTDKNGKHINKAKVSLVNNKNMQLYTSSTDADGRFSFPNLYTVNTKDFSVKATDQEGKRELNVVFNKNFETHILDFIANHALKYSLLSKDQVVGETYFKNNQELFQRAPKLFKANTIALDNQRKLLSTSTSILDVIKTLKPYRIMNNQIVFMGSENSLNYQGGALIVLDGQQMGTDISIIQNISPLEVDHINVSTNPMDIQRYTGLNSVGVIEIFLKSAKPLEDQPVRKEANFKYEDGYRIPNVFPTKPANQKRDTRTTLVWIPEQKVNESGQFEFPVTAGKVLSDFVIEVQGISENGRAGIGIAVFSVTK